jgi:hypothetical protein
MTRHSLAALLFGQVFGTVALAAPVPAHLFPKPEPVIPAPVAPPIPQISDLESWYRVRDALEARIKERAAGRYVPPLLAPGTVILQSNPVQVVPLPASPK